MHLIRLPGAVTSGTHQMISQRVRKEVSEQNKTQIHKLILDIDSDGI